MSLTFLVSKVNNFWNIRQSFIKHNVNLMTNVTNDTDVLRNKTIVICHLMLFSFGLKLFLFFLTVNKNNQISMAYLLEF